MCLIHQEKMKISELIFLECEHSFCKNCLTTYITTKLKEKIKEISCPSHSCQIEIGYQQIKDLVKNSIYDEIYENLLIENFKSDSSEKKVTCPSCKIIYAIWCDSLEFTCKSCRTTYCP